MGKLRHVNSMSLKTSFWGSLGPQFLAEGKDLPGRACSFSPDASGPALAPGPLPPVSHLPCPTRRPESSWGAGGMGTDALTSRRKVHDATAAYKVQKPGVLSEGQGGHTGVQGRFAKEAMSEFEFQKLHAWLPKI